MKVQWYGQSTFHLTAPEASVTIDPFGDMSALTSSAGLQWDYPPLEGVTPTLLLVTHEHVDHNGVEAVGGDPTILRSTAGRLESPLGEVIAIASEHDEQAGTQRGPNTIFAFELDSLRVAHFGDFGQSELRDEQAALLDDIDLLFIPVGGAATIGAEQAAEIVARLHPRWVVPMHYRTPRISFLDTADAFLERSEHVEHTPEPAFETSELPATDGPLVVVPAVP
jgi:L-ascorbate metabolism protein UlaG (beta-lactamase superfamily)